MKKPERKATKPTSDKYANPTPEFNALGGRGQDTLIARVEELLWVSEAVKEAIDNGLDVMTVVTNHVVKRSDELMSSVGVDPDEFKQWASEKDA